MTTTSANTGGGVGGVGLVLVLVLFMAAILGVPALLTQGADSVPAVAPSGSEVDFPTPPNCDGFGKVWCWIVEPGKNEQTGERQYEVRLEDGDGNTAGRTQLLEVETAEFEELEALSKQGHDTGFIGRVEVVPEYQGNGLGRSMWEAGDRVLASEVGPKAVRIVYDTIGWGASLLKGVKEFIVDDNPLWAYFVENGG